LSGRATRITDREQWEIGGFDTLVSEPKKLDSKWDLVENQMQLMKHDSKSQTEATISAVKVFTEVGSQDIKHPGIVVVLKKNSSGQIKIDRAQKNPSGCVRGSKLSLATTVELEFVRHCSARANLQGSRGGSERGHTTRTSMIIQL